MSDTTTNIGTSDPYVIFWVNGLNVFKSERIKKQLNPVWQNAKFKLAIVRLFLFFGNELGTVYSFSFIAIACDGQLPNRSV